MRFERRRGVEIVHRGRRLIPVTTLLRFGGERGFVVWSRAAHVAVADAANTRVVRVHDPTRVIQSVLLIAGALAGILIRVVGRRRRR